MNQQSLDVTVSAIGSKATYFGAGTSIASAIASVDWGFWCGILIGVVGLAVNIYFKRRQDAREQREHDARMRKLITKPADLE